MKKIIVASKNPVKINTALGGFKKMFPNEEFEIEGVSVPSGVSDQPKTDEETLNGANNRSLAAKEQYPEADFWVGIEGGISDDGVEMTSFAWVVIQGKENMGKSRTGTFLLSPKVAELIRGGLELGDADDKIFGMKNSKQQNGAVGILTKDLLTRESFYEVSVILALIPFKNPEIY